eukprot:10914014-Ditylum_brightwellii.AAC.1
MDTYCTPLPKAEDAETVVPRRSKVVMFPPFYGCSGGEKQRQNRQKMPPQHLPPANQSDYNIGVSVPRLPPMTPLGGPVLLDFTAAASTQQEMAVSTLVASPANFCQSRLSPSTVTRKMRQNT